MFSMYLPKLIDLIIFNQVITVKIFGCFHFFAFTYCIKKGWAFIIQEKQYYSNSKHIN